MRTGFMGSIVVGIAALAVTSGVLAQSAARSATAKTDLSGIWNRRAVSDRSGNFADDAGGYRSWALARVCPRCAQRGWTNTRPTGRALRMPEQKVETTSTR